MSRSYPIEPEEATLLVRVRARIARLQSDGWYQDGLSRFGSIFILPIPHPVIDRHYELVWDLPTPVQRRRWLTARRRQEDR